MRPEVVPFFDEETFTASFVVIDPDTKHCAIVDSVLDFDYAAGRIDCHSADEIIAYVHKNELTVDWILETHVHADRLSAGPYLQRALGGMIGIGENITVVQDTFGKVFNEGTEFQRDGSQFDQLFQEGDTFQVGNLEVRVLHTPGHTPACLTYVIENLAFVGDTFFMPDFGKPRVDFPGGSAETLYQSTQKLFKLPDDTRVFVDHDCKTPGRGEYAWETTIGAQTELNEHVGVGASEAALVEMRTKRDAELAMPRLIAPSLQVNMRAGKMPKAEDNGTTHLKLPVDAL